jgi:CRISPR-associated endonuclease Csn1
MFEKSYRLGIDMGSTSLGWCMLEIDADGNPLDVINMGVRIYPDGRNAKNKEPLSKARRGFRSQRRNLDRYLERVKNLVEYLIRHGFLSSNEQTRKEVFTENPYYLRCKALDDKISSDEFARAIIHLAKRRGFKSNRKAGKGAEDKDEKNKIALAMANLSNSISETGARTLGEFLWDKYRETAESNGHLRKSIKFNYKKINVDDLLIFPTREMVVAEFDAIWDSQSRFSPLFTPENKEAIKDIIFHQRPLKPQEKGKCQLLPEFSRAPKAHPVFQEFRIRQDLNNLKLIDQFANTTLELSKEQYDALYNLLSTKEKVTFKSMRKLILGKNAEDYLFNLESEKRKELRGNETYHAFNNSKIDKQLSDYWNSLHPDTQAGAIEEIVSDSDDETAIQKLIDLGIEADYAVAMIDVNLSDDYCNLSVEAMQRILPFMKEGTEFSKACALAGMDHSLEYNGEIFDNNNLPYYGEVLKRETIELNRKIGIADSDIHGKINNPTVHIALNQLRKLVNALCKRYGAPKQIVLELGKDLKLGLKEKEALEKTQRKNADLNEQAVALIKEHGLPVTHDNILKVKLWWESAKDEIDRRCIYTGKQISCSDLFSPQIEVDHILPKSRTYDDSASNKLLCYYESNRFKAEKSPFEAFGSSPQGYLWQDIISRASRLPDNKKWRFQADAMDRFSDEDMLLERMLNDTRYMSRVAMKYMFYVCGKNNVWTITGKHTAMLRAKWGLNSALGETNTKERTDHRHHAIDAFVISLTTRSFIKSLAGNIRNSRDRFLENLKPPYRNFNHEEFKAKISSIHVSYKPDQVNLKLLKDKNQTGGSLLEDTAYSYLGPDPSNPKMHLYCVRKDIAEVGLKKIDSIVAPEIQKALTEIATRYPDEKQFKEQVKSWAVRCNVKKVKLKIPSNPKTMIPVYNKEGIAFKYYATGDNLFADIYIKDPTNPKLKWDIEIVSSYHAHQPGFVPDWKKNNPKAKKVMRVYKNDVIAVDSADGTREYRRVRKMTNGGIYLREISIAKKASNLEDIGEYFSPNQLLLKRARKAGVDILGRAFDPFVNES